MKYLNQFQRFDCDSFLKGKVCRVIGVSPLLDFETKAPIGTKVETVIYQDATPYKHKDGEQGSNRYEKLTFKVHKDVKANIDDAVEPINPVATIYGEFRNQLSVKCDDIRVLTPTAPVTPTNTSKGKSLA